jgi:peptide deformylase
MDIIKNIENIKSCTSNSDLSSNQKVAAELFKVLVDNTNGNKLACNQVGINDHRVAVVNIREPLYLVNPEIIGEEFPIPYISDDLSFPQKLINTQKYGRIVVKADNFKKPITFGVKDSSDETKITDPIIMEACAIQHVVDMLDVKTMYDRVITTPKQVINVKKYYRNDIVTLEKENDQPLKMKHKYTPKYLKEGWTIKNQ